MRTKTRSINFIIPVLLLLISYAVGTSRALAGEGASPQATPSPAALAWADALQKSGVLEQFQAAMKAADQGRGEDALKLHREILGQPDLDPLVGLFVRMLALGCCSQFGYRADLATLASEGLRQARDLAAKRACMPQPEPSVVAGDWRVSTMAVASAVILVKQDATEGELTDAKGIIDTVLRALEAAVAGETKTTDAIQATTPAGPTPGMQDRILRGRIASARAAARLGNSAEGEQILAAVLVEAKDPLTQASAAYNLGQTQFENGRKGDAARPLEQAALLLKANAPKNSAAWQFVQDDIERMLGDIRNAPQQ